MKLSLYYCRSLELLLWKVKKQTKIAKIGHVVTSNFQQTISQQPYQGQVFYLETSWADIQSTYQQILSTGLLEIQPPLPEKDAIILKPGEKLFIYVIVGKKMNTLQKSTSIQRRVNQLEMKSWLTSKQHLVRQLQPSTSVCYL